MNYRALGRSGINVSRLCLGTATFGVSPPQEDATALVQRALDLGINFFDTANTYGNQPRFDRPGLPPAEQRESAEELLGRALLGRRHEAIVATKVQEKAGPGVNDGGPGGAGLSRLHIMRQVEHSLRRLRTDYIDVYHAHHPDPTIPLDQPLRAFEDLIRQGKVRYVGLSAFAAWEMTATLWVCDALGAGAPVCNQIPYSLVRRDAERDLLPACLHFGVGLTASSPLGGGLLSEMEKVRRPFAGSARWGGPAFNEVELSYAQRLNDLAAAWGHHPAQIALAWLLAKPGLTSAIIGPGSVANLEADVPAAELELDGEQMAALDAIAAPAPAVR